MTNCENHPTASGAGTPSCSYCDVERLRLLCEEQTRTIAELAAERDALRVELASVWTAYKQRVGEREALLAAHVDYEALNAEYLASKDRLLARAEAADRALDEAKAVLAAIQFSAYGNAGGGTCPWCRNITTAGHAPDCRLARVLGRETK